MISLKVGRAGRKLEAAVNFTTKAFSRVGSILLIAMVVLVAADAFSRYVFNNSIKGVLDFVELALVFIVFLALGEVAVRKRHIAVDLVTSRLTESCQILVNTIVAFACAVITLLIAWQLGVRGWLQLIDPSRYTENLEIPLGPFILVAALGSLILAFVFLIDFFRYLFLWVEKKEN